MADDDILDPAHDDSLSAGAAGIPTPEVKDDKKDNKDEIHASDDGNMLEKDGIKYIRSEALHAEREKNAKLSKQLQALDAVLPEFEEFLTQKQNRGRATVDRASRGPDLGDYSEDELDGLAITRGYYLDDGRTPDRQRAKQELDIVTRVADRRAERYVKPVAERTLREQANVNRERARQAKFVDGQPIAGQKFVDAAVESLGDEFMADPKIANMAQVVAAGLEYLEMRREGTLRPGRKGGREPMFVERGSGRYDGDDGELSALDIAAARARGKTPEQWAKQQKAANRSTGPKGDILEEV